jgi:hypothetical protein
MKKLKNVRMNILIRTFKTTEGIIKITPKHKYTTKVTADIIIKE